MSSRYFSVTHQPGHLFLLCPGTKGQLGSEVANELWSRASGIGHAVPGDPTCPRSPKIRPVGAFGLLPYANKKSVFGLCLDRALQVSVQDEDLALCLAQPSEGMGWPCSCLSLLTEGEGDSLATPPSSRAIVGCELHSPYPQWEARPVI